MVWAMPAMPPWISSLPRDERQFPVPAEAGWEGKRPVISKVSTDRAVLLGTRRGCAVCGHTLPRGSLVYRAWSQVDAAQIRGFERENAFEVSSPLHKSCILFSAIACPYLRERNARLRKDSEIAPGARRGGRAAVMGFETYSLLIREGSAGPDPSFSYVNLTEDVPYADGEELLGLYEEAMIEDARIIDTSQARHYWTDRQGDQKRLRAAANRFKRQFATATPAYAIEVQGKGRYHAFPM